MKIRMLSLLCAILLIAPSCFAQTWQDQYALTQTFAGNGGDDFINTLTLKLGASTSGGITWTWPNSLGSNGQMLITDGSGNWSYATPLDGSTFVLLSPATTARNTVQATNTSSVPLSLKLSATSTQDLLDFLNGSTVISNFDNLGNLYYGSNPVVALDHLSTGNNGAIVYNGTSFISSAGTSGQVLTSNGAGVTPTFQAVAAASNAVIINPATTARNLVVPTADVVPVSLQTYPAGTSHLLEFQNDNGSVVSSVGYIQSDGAGYFNGGVSMGLGGTTTGTAIFFNSANGNSATVVSGSQGSSRVYTIPDAGASTSFVMAAGNSVLSGQKTFTLPIIGGVTGNAGTVTNGVYTVGNQNIGGVKSFTSPAQFNSSVSVDQLLSLGDDLTPTAGAISFNDGTISNAHFITQQTATALSGSYTYTMPDAGANANFVMSEGAQTINGALTTTSLLTGSGGFSGDGSLLTNLPTSALTGTLGVSHGGTGATSLTAHGVIIGNGTSAVNVTSAGTSGYLLTSQGSGADPVWTAPAAAVTDYVATDPATTLRNLIKPTADVIPLRVQTTGAGATANLFTAENDNGTSISTVFSVNPSGNVVSAGTISANPGFKINGGSATSGHYLRGNGTNYVDGTIQAADVPTLDASIIGTGTLPIARGGTSTTTPGSNQNVLRNSAGTVSFGTLDLSSSGAVGSSVLGFLNGGTGSSSFTTNNLVYSNGAQLVSVGTATAGNILMGNTGGAPSWVTLSSSSLGGVLTEAKGGTHISSYSTGDMLYASAGNTLSALPIGTSGQVLKVDPTGVPVWGTASAGGVTSFNTRTGAVVSTTGDYSASQVTNAADVTASNTFQTGPQTVQRNGIATTQTDAVVLDNTTASTSGVPNQYSPDIHWKARTWNTGTVANNVLEYRTYVETASGSSPTSKLKTQFQSTNLGSWFDLMSLTSGGDLDIVSGLLINGAATSGNYLRGNGTRFVSASLSASDVASGILAVARGGTGSGAPTTNTIFRNEAGTTAFGTLDLSRNYFTNALPVLNGGTGLTTYTGAGRLLYSGGATNTQLVSPPGTRAMMYYNPGTPAPAWADNSVYFESGLVNFDFDAVNVKFKTGSASGGIALDGSSANARIGTATLSGGTVTVTTSAVTSTSVIFLTHASSSANAGILNVGTVTAGTSFVIHSSNASDATNVNWIIFDQN